MRLAEMLVRVSTRILFSLTAVLPPQGEGGADEWSATDEGTIGLIVQ